MRALVFEDYGKVGDTLIPAVPGTYDTHRYLSLVSSPAFTQGITYQLTVARHR